MIDNTELRYWIAAEEDAGLFSGIGLAAVVVMLHSDIRAMLRDLIKRTVRWYFVALIADMTVAISQGAIQPDIAQMLANGVVDQFNKRFW